jgi:hypothetical protein
VTRVVGTISVLLGMAGSTFACAVSVPEIDATTGVGALALLSAGLLIIRARQNRQRK